MTDYMKTQGLVDGITGCRNRQRKLEAEIERLRAVVDAAWAAFDPTCECEMCSYLATLEDE